MPPSDLADLSGSIPAWVLPAEFRGQGVARALLDGAVAYARKYGARLIEAYPLDRPGRSTAEAMWFGAKTMYDQAGFREVARRNPDRPIVRLGRVKVGETSSGQISRQAT